MARENSREILKLAQRFADAGIAALVYDKRGAGKSGGEYEGNQSVSEKNIALLADDAATALATLAGHRSLKGTSRRTRRHQSGRLDRAVAAERSGSANSWCCGAGPSAR